MILLQAIDPLLSLETAIKKVTNSTKHLPTNEIKAVDIIKSANGHFNIKSKNSAGVTYEVDPLSCMCTCPAGRSGASCKHLVGVHLHTDATLFIFPPDSLEEKHKYHEIAFGWEPATHRYASISDKHKSNTQSNMQAGPVDATIVSLQNQLSEQTITDDQETAQSIDGDSPEVENTIAETPETVQTTVEALNDVETIADIPAPVVQTITDTPEVVADDQVINSKSLKEVIYEKIEAMLHFFKHTIIVQLLLVQQELYWIQC